MHPDVFPVVFPFFEADGGVIHPASETTAYNCIAWAVGRTDQPWWPAAGDNAFWPDGVPNEETVEAFVLAFATLGFVICETGDSEVGYEKIALYALDGKPTHAARQLPDGKWTSKLGKESVVTHNTPRGVEGPLYGVVCCYLRRQISTAGA
jgi:hypothetical protein